MLEGTTLPFKFLTMLLPLLPLAAAYGSRTGWVSMMELGRMRPWQASYSLCKTEVVTVPTELAFPFVPQTHPLPWEAVRDRVPPPGFWLSLQRGRRQKTGVGKLIPCFRLAPGCSCEVLSAHSSAKKMPPQLQAWGCMR